MMKNINKYLALAAFIFIPMISNAQVLPFTAAETDAASLRKAGADLVETGSVSNAAFRNAAAIPFYEGKMDAAAGFTMWAPTKTNMINASVAYNAGGKFGVAAGVFYGMDPEYTITSDGGATKGTFKPSSMHLNAGLAYKFLPYLSAGANIGYASSSLAEGRSYGALTADVFLMGKFSDLKVTAGVSNIGSSVVAESGAKFKLPTAVSFGAGYDKTFAEKHKLSVCLDADYYLADGIAAAAAAEYGFDSMLFLSAGYRYGGNTPIPSYASVGLGAAFKGVKIDLAYLLGSEYLGNTLAIGLGYSF